MKMETPQELARWLKEDRGGLLMAGEMCNEIEFNGKSLLDLAADIAKGLGLPVAATGNTVVALRERGVKPVGRIMAAEVVEFMRSGWGDPLTPQRPSTLVLIGYSPGVARQLVSTVTDARTAVLGPAYVEGATCSLPDLSVKAWGQYLEELVHAVQGVA
jgi:CO dehydrogenase/acetyl-CoA synthase epsilon subunit